MVSPTVCLTSKALDGVVPDLFSVANTYSQSPSEKKTAGTGSFPNNPPKPTLKFRQFIQHTLQHINTLTPTWPAFFLFIQYILYYLHYTLYSLLQLYTYCFCRVSWYCHFFFSYALTLVQMCTHTTQALALISCF